MSYITTFKILEVFFFCFDGGVYGYTKMVPVELISYLLVSFTAILTTQTIAFLAHAGLRRVDTVDIAWGMSFVVSYVALQVYSLKTEQSVLVAGLLVTV